MNDDSNPENLPSAAEEARPAAPRKRVRKPKAASVGETLPAASGDPTTTAAADLPPSAQRSAEDERPRAVQDVEVAAAPEPASVGTNGPSGGIPVVDGERTKRPRRRGRRGKEGREGRPGDPNPAPNQATRQVDGGGSAAPRPDLEPQTRQRLGETFTHVTSDGYDEDTTPTDQELRELEERAQVADADLQADAASTDDSVSAANVVPGETPGTVDGDTAAAPDAPAASDRRVLAPQHDAPKLQKVLAQSGAGSRRDIEQWIAEGRVTVNGKAAHTGQRVSYGDRVAVDGKPVRVRIAPLPTRVIAYHKPVGEIVTHDDPQQRPTVFRKLPRLVQGKWQSVGRLDINTEGLLLFTNSGELANQLMHPRFGIEREYAVRVLGSLDGEARTKLLEGVDVEGQRAAFLSIDEGSGDGANRWYRVTIAEGRHREVRRLFDAVGLAVSRLIRIRYGAVVLPRGLKRGVWVDLAEGDVKALRRMVGIGDRSERADRGDRGDRGERAGRHDDARGGKDRRGRGSRGGQGQGRPPQDGRGPGPGRAPHERRDPVAEPKGRRGDRQGRGGGARGEGPIPNPLLQTYDRRAAQEARRTVREYGEDGPIPNPLQQNFDQRALRESNRMPRREYGDEGPIPNPLQQNFDKRQVQGRGDALVLGRRHQGRGQPGQPQQPDPMQTAVGYIGADAFHTKMAQGRGNKGQGGRRRR